MNKEKREEEMEEQEMQPPQGNVQDSISQLCRTRRRLPSSSHVRERNFPKIS